MAIAQNPEDPDLAIIHGGQDDLRGAVNFDYDDHDQRGLLHKLCCWMKFAHNHRWKKAAGAWALLICGFIVLLIICGLQSAVCFHRDGFVVTIQESTSSRTVCDAEYHLIITNIAQQILVIVAYILLVVYALKWYPESQERMMRQGERDVPPPSILKISIMFIAAIIWIALSFGARLMQALAFGLFPNREYILHISWETSNTTLLPVVPEVLGGFCLAGFILIDVVYLAVVAVYGCECEFVCKVIRAHSKLIMEGRCDDKSKIPLSLQETIQEIGIIRKYTKYINGKVSWLVSVVFFNFASSTVIGLWSLHELYQYKQLYIYDFPLASASQALSIILWLVLLFVPVCQAARVTANCAILRKSSCDVLEEKASTWTPDIKNEFQEAEVYTLYLNTVSTELQAKMFGIPIQPWAVCSVIVVVAFLLLLLIETDTYIVFSPLV